ncbi:MAG: membrane protein [Thermonema sp.]|uniref:YfhO family protein n=1 Tax=Thermonema sp. TaxID=2231181 RepID=UPI0021DC735C|nr:YfhO family protein [Thermonema sp.]GIV40051.1 MAG: membrane protein [Thermonema sp.]
MNLKRIGIHAGVALLFLLIAIAYMPEVLQGKILLQHDILQGEAASHQNEVFHRQTGEQPLWADNMFSGMPGYFVYMQTPASIPTTLGRVLFFDMGLNPANFLFWAMLCMYLAACLLGASPAVAVVCALAYAFGSYNIISIEAGHISKVIAIATLPAVVGSVIYAYRQQSRAYRLLALSLLLFFTAIHLYSNHIQISYYGALILLLYFFFELYLQLRAKAWKPFVFTSLLLVATAGLALSTYSTRLLTTYEYSRYSIRGKPELSTTPLAVLEPEKKDSLQAAASQSDGLDMDYAFQWSYGKAESLTLLIPHFMGGGSMSGLDQQSGTYKALVQLGVPPATAAGFVRQLPLYWGEQPFTAGPAYLGAAFALIFLFAFLSSRHPLRWWAMASVLLLLMIAWGKNWLWFNELMFRYFPLFNKFRAVTMTLTLLPLPMGLMIALWWKEWREQQNQAGWQDHNRRMLIYAAGSLGGLTLLLAIAGGLLFNFSAPQDTQLMGYLTQAFGNERQAWAIMEALRQDRQAMMQADAWRSFFFIAVAAGLLWWLIRQPRQQAVWWGLALLCLIDLWAVDKKYLNKEDFRSKYEKERFWQPTEADKQILQDSSYFRVLNLTVSPFNDATTSYWHNSVGGYHGAKLRIYQDLIEGYLSRQQWHIYDMLNTKYVIVKTPEGQTQVQRNDGALGAAWWVERWRWASNADEEFRALKELQPAVEAVLRKEYQTALEGLQPAPVDSSEYIRIVHQEPHRYVYETQSKRERLAVFSEIYYPEGWKATIDGKEAPILRANYVLRALRIPAGKHEVRFEFRPASYEKGQKIDLVASIVWLLAIAGSIFFAVRLLRTTSHKE